MREPDAHSSPARSETRLLVVTIAVSVVMLLVLARFRFPGAGTRQPAAAPLERLAARATFDELASIMDDLWRRVSPSIAVIALQGERPPLAFIPAVRVGGTRAIAIVGRDERVDGSAGTPARVIARAAAGDLAVLDLESPGEAAGTPAGTSASGPRYVAVFEATANGPAVRPLFVGRTDLFEDPRGTGSLLRVMAGQQTLSHGAAVFALDGTLIGLATQTAGVPAIVPASIAAPLAESAPAAPPRQADLGVDVQALTASLAGATRATTGVVVTRVRNTTTRPALASGDVIQSIDGTRVESVAAFMEISETRTPGTAVTLGVVRRGSAMTIEAVAADSSVDGPPPSQPDNGLGAILRTVARAGTEVVAVSLDSAAARAGLTRGDLIVSLNGVPSPDARAIERAYDAAPAGDAVLVTIQRMGEHRVVALEKR